jgi:hypothetical protein
VVPHGFARGFGVVYAALALIKMVAAVTQTSLCGGPAPGTIRLAVASGVVEASIGLAAASRGPRGNVGALVGTAFNVGLVGFAVVADIRGIDLTSCGCFGGIDLPWTAHAAIAGALALVFLAILLDSERRRAASA